MQVIKTADTNILVPLKTFIWSSFFMALRKMTKFEKVVVGFRLKQKRDAYLKLKTIDMEECVKDVKDALGEALGEGLEGCYCGILDDRMGKELPGGVFKEFSCCYGRNVTFHPMASVMGGEEGKEARD